MSKKDQRGVPNSGRTPAERTALAREHAEKSPHLAGGADRDYGTVPASELNGMTPVQRAASRGAKYELSDPFENANPRGEVRARQAKRTASTLASGRDQSENRVAHKTIYGDRQSHPQGERKTGAAFGLERKDRAKF